MEPQHPFARALVAFAEALVAERRVLVVGDASLALHDLLSELGARVVHVYDPEAARALSQPPPTARGTVLRGLPEGDFDVRDGAFDLALVPELAAVADPAALLARLRRVVGPEGAVLCAAANDEEGGIDYYALYDLVSLQFEHVRMVAAMPFFGVTLAELGQDEVESAVRVDTQLAGERSSPAAYLALASQSDVALDAYAVIELEPPPAPAPAQAAPRGEDEAALAEARLRVEVLEAQVHELGEARTGRARAEEEARRALESLEAERERARRLERDLDALASAKAKEPAPRDRDAELAEQLAHAQIRASALEEGVELAERTIVVQRDRIAELEARLLEVEEALAARAAPPPEPERELEAEPEPDDVLDLETKLRERADKVAELEAEAARRAKLVRELVARLEADAGLAPDPALERKLDELAVLAARQQSELEARGWRIAELERRATGPGEPRA